MLPDSEITAQLVYGVETCNECGAEVEQHHFIVVNLDGPAVLTLQPCGHQADSTTVVDRTLHLR